jgi:hypothetical protein
MAVQGPPGQKFLRPPSQTIKAERIVVQAGPGLKQDSIQKITKKGKMD